MAIRYDKTLAKKIWVYQEGSLKYGCTFTLVKDEPHPKRILYLEIPATDNTKPSRSARHLKTKHLDHEDKPLQFFSVLRYSFQYFTRFS